MSTTDVKQPTTAFRAPHASKWRALTEVEGAENSQAEVREARGDLKNMLLASLQMQHLVVLAGSGCSLSAGGPSMLDLWNGAVGQKPTEAARLNAAKVNHDLSDNNIEAFLSRIEAFLQVNEDAEVAEFLNASKCVILDKCSEFLHVDKLEAHKTFLRRLSRRRVRDQRLKLFTTNYDLCFEWAAAELGGVALDGFSFAAPRRYDPRFFDYDIVRRPRSGEDPGSYLEGVFLLYKLHGSVNWSRGSDGAIFEKTKPKPTEACLIYPARGKYQQSFTQPHVEPIAQYLIALRAPNTCVLVVGFGFNDDHLAEPLLAAAKSNPRLRLIVVDPSAEAKSANGNRYWTQFAELSDREEDVWFIAADFDYLTQLIPDLKSLTPADNMMKALKDVSR